MCGISAAPPAGNGLPKKRSGSCCQACGANIPSPIPAFAGTWLCRREGIADGLYYTWSKEFPEAGKKRLAGDTQRQASSSEVKDLRREARDLKELVADLTLENRLLKKACSGWGRPRMRYPVHEKLEIIRIVEQSHLPVKRTLAKIGVSRPTFYRWYDLYQRFGEAGLEDRRSGPARSWNRIADTVREQILDMALDRPELSPRELAVTFIL